MSVRLASAPNLGLGAVATQIGGATLGCARRKVHLGIDADTLQIRAIVVTTNEVGDSPVGAELLNQIPSHETVASFTGDGAYDTQECMRLVTGGESPR